MAELVTRSRLDSRGVEVGVKKTSKAIKPLEKQLSEIRSRVGAAFAINTLTRFGRSITDLGSKISDLAFAADLTTDEFQALSVAFINAGGTSEKLGNALSRIRAAQGRVVEGDQTMIDAFRALGVSIQDVISLDMPGLLQRIGGSLEESGNSARQFNAVVELVGTRNAPKLTEALNRLSSEGMSGLIDSAKDAGKILDEDLIASLDKWEDSLLQTERTIKVWAANSLKNIESVFGAVANFVQGFSGDKDARVNLLKSFTPVGALTNPKAFKETVKNIKSGIKLVKDVANVNKQIDKQDSERRKKKVEEERKFQKDLRKDTFDRIQEEKNLETVDPNPELTEALRAEDAKKRPEEKKPSISSLRPSSDRITQLGGSIGGQANPIINVAREQLKRTDEIASNTRPIKEMVGKIDGVGGLA